MIAPFEEFEFRDGREEARTKAKRGFKGLLEGLDDGFYEGEFDDNVRISFPLPNVCQVPLSQI
jgi:hypothetical protein